MKVKFDAFGLHKIYKRGQSCRIFMVHISIGHMKDLYQYGQPC